MTLSTSKLSRAPSSEPLWLPGDGPAGEPKYDNVRSGRYPLEEEYRAGRLGKYSAESAILWATAGWFERVHDLAMRPANAANYGVNRVTSADIGGFVDKNTPDAMGSTDPMGYRIERDPLARLCERQPSLLLGSVTTYPIEERTAAIQIRRELKRRLDCNYRHLQWAVIDHREMKDIGIEEGMKSGAAAAGRSFVHSALRTASIFRTELAGRTPANDNTPTQGG